MVSETCPTTSSHPLKRAVRAVLPTAAWTALRLLRLRWALATYREREVSHLYGGSRLRVVLTDPMAEGWYDRDWPEVPEIQMLAQHRLREGAVVFDLGAHQGVVALMLARYVGSSGKVVAVEASPHNATVAERNRNLNDAPQLTIVHAAVGESNGSLFFNKSFNGSVADETGAWGRFEVQALTIDELARHHGEPDVLFMDIEGFECRALKGATETLKRRPDCFVEVHVGCGLESFGGSVDDIAASFPPERFQRWMLSDSDPEGRPFDLADPMTRERFYLVALGRPDTPETAR
jgi:FkbM family methyltransferase